MDRLMSGGPWASARARASIRGYPQPGGNFVLPTLDSVKAAAAAVATDMPHDFRVSITDSSGQDAYPISSFTWLLVPTRFADADKGKAMKSFLVWILDDGQKLAPPLLYAPLPAQVINLERDAIASVQVGP